MDLRLTVSRAADSTVVHVDGRLAVRCVDDLQRAVTDSSGTVILDLTNLLSADDAGVAALRLLRQRGAQLRGASPYVRLLLNTEVS